MLKNIARYDAGNVQGEAYLTDEGYIKANAIVTRTGVFTYKNPDGTIRKEYRPSDEVLNEDSLKSLHMIPVTNGHPEERLVTAENSKRLSIGYTGETVTFEEPYLLANFVITDLDAVKDVIENNRKELSLGYTVDLIPKSGEFEGEDYDYIQTNIRYNHLSIVQKARAGSEARIALDEEDAFEINYSNRESSTMAKRKIKIDQEEMMVEPVVAEHVEKLMMDLKNLQDEKRRVEEEMKMISDKLESATAEKDSMSEKVSSMESEMANKMDSSEIQKKVKDRFKLHKLADKTLSYEQIEKLDSMSDMEIKKNIILSVQKNADLSNKSDVYIQARFDSVVEDLNSQCDVKFKVAEAKNFKKDSSDSSSARSNMIEKMQKAHIGG